MYRLGCLYSTAIQEKQFQAILMTKFMTMEKQNLHQNQPGRQVKIPLTLPSYDTKLYVSFY